MDLNVKPRNIKLPEETIREYFHDFEVSEDFLVRATKIQIIKEKN